MNIKTGLHTRMKAGFLSFMSINGSYRQKVIKKFVVLHLKQTVKFGDNAVFHDAFTYFLALRKYKDYNLCCKREQIPRIEKENEMKKTLAFLLALVMVFSLCACGSSAAEATPAPAEATPEATEAPAVSEETAAALSKWTNDLYEPETSITYSATIVWPADATAVDTAAKDVRPNTMIVAVDENLAVSTLNGEALSDNLAEYLASVKGTTLPALYISDDATAAAVNAFAAEYSLADTFVVADYEHTQYVKDICDANVGILGIIDWREAELSTERSDLLTVIQNTNASHAKIAIIPEEIATLDAVEYMRGMLLTVWAETSADTTAIYTQITNGVNGIVCEDYTAVAEAISSFNDVTTLVRHVFITGHRGLPSQYVENTIRSERAAIDAGANVIECDISMSSDGELFVLHDDDAKRLFNRPDVTNVEDLTIAELQAMPYDMTDASAEEAPNSVLNSNNTNRTTERREDTVINYDPNEDHIPTLREYLEALNDEDVEHFIEIKSYNPDIVTPFKALIKEMGMEDRVCVITFNDGINHWTDGSSDPSHDVMARMAEEWPEMSLGYLGGGMYNWGDLDAVEAEQGIGAAVGQLYSYLQPYNSTCNDWNSMMYKNVIFAARHRGLTSWAWTYNTEEQFAQDYLFGGTYSMTTNFSTWATNLPVRVVADDMTVSNGDAFACTVLAQNGDVLDGCKLSLVSISGVPVSLDENGNIVANEAGEAVVMVRLDNTLDINGWDLSELSNTDYAIYSTPITITVK